MRAFGVPEVFLLVFCEVLGLVSPFWGKSDFWGGIEKGKWNKFQGKDSVFASSGLRF